MKHFTALQREKRQRERHWLFALPVTFWVLGGFYAVELLTGVTLVILHQMGITFATVDRNLYVSALSAVVYGAFLLLVLGLPRLLKLWSARLSFTKQIGLDRLPRWFDIVLAVCGFIAYLALSLLITTIVAHVVAGFNGSQSQDTGFSTTLDRFQALLAFTTLVVVAPVCEEIIFRGYLFGTLRRVIGFWGSTLLTSVAFAFVHLQLAGGGLSGWNVAVDVFALSLILCVLREYTGSIWGGIIVHMMKNTLAFGLLYVTTNHIL